MAIDDPKTRVLPPDEPKVTMDDRLLQMFERFMERTNGNGLTADQLEKVLESNAKSVQKAMKPENNEGSYPPFSAFNPDGRMDKPKLRRKTIYVGAPMRDDFLTTTEVELFNRFDKSREARNGRWKATIVKNGTAEELHVTVPHKDISDRMDLPNGLTLILRELLDGPEAASADFLAERVAALEKQLAAPTAH